MKMIKMNNGVEIPQVGLGTWRLTDKNIIQNVIENAIDIGYRHFDCALVYENEAMIGDIFENIYKKGKVTRKDLFFTGKLWNAHHKRAEIALKQTLNDLKTGYLDLYLIHWPVSFKCDEKGETIRQNDKPVLDDFDIVKLWPQMVEFVNKGYVRSIGVANFGIENITKILALKTMKPAMCQIEINPYCKQKELIDFCRKSGITVTSYSSLGSLKTKSEPCLLDDDVLKTLAKEKNMTVPQLILGWIIAKDIIVIPKSSSYERLKENFEIKPLDERSCGIIDNLSVVHKYVDLPEFGPNRFK